MRQYVPSEVVAYIDRELAFVPRDLSRSQVFTVSRHIRATLLGLVEIAERVPDHLVVDTDALTDIIVSVQAIRTVAREAETQPVRSYDRNVPGAFPVEGPELAPSADAQWNPVILIRNAFERCPDGAPAPHVKRLPFVTDDRLRHTLETDLDGVDRALAGSEWKAATVLGGSVVEALLLWSIQQKPQELQIALAKLQAGTPKKNLGPDPEKWYLSDYIAVASEMNLIRPTTATQASLLTGFRNLIHPGRVARTGQACNRGTAHAAQAAIAFVIEDLK